MLFSQRFWPGLHDGSVTVTFRTWKRAQVIAGRSYRTAAGMLAVERVDVVGVAGISDDDARRAGFTGRDELVTKLGVGDDAEVYRIEFHHDGDDPLHALRDDDDLSAEELAGLVARLERLDRSSPRGPWTATFLRTIAARPGVRAGDLAADQGWEIVDYKRSVRQLKALGLTESLEVGYRLSPRGAVVLAELPAGG